MLSDSVATLHFEREKTHTDAVSMVPPTFYRELVWMFSAWGDEVAAASSYH